MFRSNRERPGFFKRWSNRLAAVIVLGIIIAIILLMGNCSGWGLGGGSGDAGNKGKEGNGNESEPVSVNNADNNSDSNSSRDIAYSFFVLRFTTEEGEFKSSQATLHMPDGTVEQISGYQPGNDRPSIDLYYDDLRRKLSAARDTEAFRSTEFDTIYLEIVRDENKERLQGQNFVKIHEEIVREYFGTSRWEETEEINNRLKKPR